MSHDHAPISYDIIGGNRADGLVKSLSRAAVKYAEFDGQHNALLYKFLAVAYDISIRFAGSRPEWRQFCKSERWWKRQIKPKDDASIDKICDFVALSVFSTARGSNDDRATKYGRVIGLFAADGLRPDEVEEYLKQHGIEALLERAYREHPRRPKSKTTKSDAKVSGETRDHGREGEQNDLNGDNEANEYENDDDIAHPRHSQNGTPGGKPPGRSNPRAKTHSKVSIEVTHVRFAKIMSMEIGQTVDLTLRRLDGPTEYKIFEGVKMRNVK